MNFYFMKNKEHAFFFNTDTNCFVYDEKNISNLTAYSSQKKLMQLLIQAFPEPVSCEELSKQLGLVVSEKQQLRNRISDLRKHFKFNPVFSNIQFILYHDEKKGYYITTLDESAYQKNLNDKIDSSKKQSFVSSSNNSMDLINNADYYYKNKQYIEAIPLYKQALFSFSPSNLNPLISEKYTNLALCYAQIPSKNKEEKRIHQQKAFRYFLYVSEKGNNIVAIHNLGFYYFFGIGCKKDIKKAKEWFEKAANLGSIASEHMLKKYF